MSRTRGTVSRALGCVLVLGLVTGACGGEGGQESTTVETQETQETQDVQLTVVVQSEDAIHEHVVPALEEQNITLAMTPALSAEALAQALAEQANPQTSGFYSIMGPGNWEKLKSFGARSTPTPYLT